LPSERKGQKERIPVFDRSLSNRLEKGLTVPLLLVEMRPSLPLSFPFTPSTQLHNATENFNFLSLSFSTFVPLYYNYHYQYHHNKTSRFD
uniref:Ovule protein n=1 Tax=Hydatigena taeniaeformis TaxID=6205 RepID=A0A0R3X3R2_HYDTA